MHNRVCDLGSYDRIPNQNWINLFKTHSFLCILLALPRISLKFFVLYRYELYLSTPAFQLTVHWVIVGLLSKHCRIWNIWFRLLYGPLYGLSCYLNHSRGLWHYLLGISYLSYMYILERGSSGKQVNDDPNLPIQLYTDKHYLAPSSSYIFIYFIRHSWSLNPSILPFNFFFGFREVYVLTCFIPLFS